MQDNLLSCGLETLTEIKNNLTQLNEIKQQSQAIATQQKELEKRVDDKEKTISEEVEVALKKRRTEIEDSYNDQIEKVRSKIRKVKAKRDAEKKLQVNERIKEETKELREERIGLKTELKAVYEKNHIPAIFNNDLYHALFVPRGLKDIAIILIVLTCMLFVIPLGTYYFFLPQKTVCLVLAYVVTVSLFVMIYLGINTKVKKAHSNAVIDIRAVRAKLSKNHKKIRAMERQIRKDKDESNYSLVDYNEKIQSLDEEFKAVSDEKKQTLIDFETKAAKIIQNDIHDKYCADLEQMKKEQDDLSQQEKQADEKIKNLMSIINNQYEPFLGKELLKTESIDQLAEYIQNQQAQTIAQAIKCYETNHTGE